jgi:hypothetical protein
MQVINPAGIEVTVDARGWEQIVRRGEADKFRKVPTKTEGLGPKNKIALLLHGNGIGDCVHSLPAIIAKIREGFEITVMAEESLCPFFAKAGCETIAVHSDQDGSLWTDKGSILGFIPEHMNEYGAFYSLKHWCVAHDEDTSGDSTLDRFRQFAGYIEIECPEKFDWRPYLI